LPPRCDGGLRHSDRTAPRRGSPRRIVASISWGARFAGISPSRRQQTLETRREGARGQDIRSAVIKTRGNVADIIAKTVWSSLRAECQRGLAQRCSGVRGRSPPCTASPRELRIAAGRLPAGQQPRDAEANAARKGQFRDSKSPPTDERAPPAKRRRGDGSPTPTRSNSWSRKAASSCARVRDLGDSLQLAIFSLPNLPSTPRPRRRAPGGVFSRWCVNPPAAPLPIELVFFF